MEKEDLGLLAIFGIALFWGFVIVVINILEKRQKSDNRLNSETKEKLICFFKILGTILWNILKWTVLVAFGAIALLFSVLTGVKLYDGAIQKRKTYKPSRNFWNKG